MALRNLEIPRAKDFRDFLFSKLVVIGAKADL